MAQATTKINLAIDRLPQFKSCNLSHPDAGPQHTGSIHIGSEWYDTIHFIHFQIYVLMVYLQLMSQV